MKKVELQHIVENMVERLGNREKLGEFMTDLHDYATELDEAGNLTEEQTEALQNAQELVEVQRSALVGAGLFSEEAFNAIEADESGGDLQIALAVIQTLTGSDDMRKQQVKLAGIERILGEACEVAIPLTVTAEAASLGAKSTRSGGSRQNPDRPSLRVLKNGLTNAVYWRYSKVFYEIVNTPDGMRVFNLNTREEVTNGEDLPETASKAQKLVTGSWGDAFRGYITQLPDDCGVEALKPAELS